MPNTFALVVGINQYSAQGPVPPLRGCMADAQAVRKVLLDPIGLPEENVRLLCNEQATRDAIIAGWRTHLIGKAQAGDLLYFHYSGHGSQAPSIDPNEADTLDETLVAYDSREPGRYDILDKELAQLIAEAEAKDAQVVVFLDCCHSGSGTRREVAAQRRCQADQRVRPPETVLAGAALQPALTRSGRAQTAKTHHLLLAACRDEELANEYAAPEVGWHGAATFFYLQALTTQRKPLKWSELYELIYANVHTIYPAQSPQLSGPGNLVLFGGVGETISGYLLVTDVVSRADGTTERVRIEASALVGVTQGARLALFPSGSDLTGSALANAVVTETAIDHVWAVLDRPAVILNAARARLTVLGAGVMAHLVATEDALLQSAIRGGAGAQAATFVRLATAGESAAAPFHVYVDEGRYLICDPAGVRLVVDAQPATAAGAAKAVIQLEHLAIYRNVRTLRNLALEPALRGAVRISEPESGKSSRSGRIAPGEKVSLRQEGGELQVRSGQQIWFDVTNQSQRPLYVSVFLLGADYSIQRIMPEDSRYETVAPGGKLRQRPGIDVTLPAQVQRGSAVIKVFVAANTSAATAFESLTLPALNQGELFKTADTRNGTTLGALLHAVRRSGTRPVDIFAEENTDDLWYVEEVEMTVVNQ